MDTCSSVAARVKWDFFSSGKNNSTQMFNEWIKAECGRGWYYSYRIPGSSDTSGVYIHW